MVKHILAHFCFFLFAFYSGTLSSLSSHSIAFPNEISLVNLSIPFLIENKKICLSSTMTCKILPRNPLSNLTFSHTALFWASRKPHQIAYFSKGEISLFLSQPKMTSIDSGLPAEHLILHNQALLSYLLWGAFCLSRTLTLLSHPSMCLKHYMIVSTRSTLQRLIYMAESFSSPKRPEGLILICRKKKFRAQSSYLVIGFMPICWGSKWT